MVFHKVADTQVDMMSQMENKFPRNLTYVAETKL